MIGAHFIVAAVVAFLATPGAIALARRTDFYDKPRGYKRHRTPTPYLGGAAVIGSVLLVSVVLGGVTGHEATILACAAVLWLLGTIDDRIAIPPLWRVLAEVGIGVLLYERGLGWSISPAGLLDLPLTVLWVVGLTNAFNLMDNLDGAASTVTAVSAAGIGALALADGATGLAALAFALSGACVGFLPYNLAGPARIFLGDGGSMPLGMLIAALSMSAAQHTGLGGAAVVAAGLLAGLPILDTTLVSFSRWRRDVSLVQGGRDHLTHRLLSRLGSPRAVAAVLALVQAGLCGLALAGYALGVGATVAIGVTALLSGVVAVIVLDSPAWAPTPAIRLRARHVAPSVELGGAAELAAVAELGSTPELAAALSRAP